MRLPRGAKTGFKRSVLVAFFLRLVGVEGADAVEAREPYLQARFDDRAARVLTRADPESVYRLTRDVMSSRAVVRDHAPFPRALATVAVDDRVAALVALLWCRGNAATVRACAEIVTRESGYASAPAIDGLVAWIGLPRRPRIAVDVSF